jgi:hypothetical protein
MKEKGFKNFPHNTTVKQGLLNEQNDATMLQRHLCFVYRNLTFFNSWINPVIDDREEEMQ